MLKLFAVMLGGRAEGCNIELHDVVFVTGNSLEETYPKLINKWFGNKKRLHIDSSIELNFADGHEVLISQEKFNSDKKLFFVNFGGYKSDYFGEIHEIGFYVASSKPEVLAKAKNNLCVSLSEQHCDDNLMLDDVISVNEVDGYFIHLLPSQKLQAPQINSVYRKLNATTS